MCYCAMLLKLLQNLHIFFQWFKFKTDILKGVFPGSLGLANQGTRQFGGTNLLVSQFVGQKN